MARRTGVTTAINDAITRARESGKLKKAVRADLKALERLGSIADTLRPPARLSKVVPPPSTTTTTAPGTTTPDSTTPGATAPPETSTTNR